MSKDPETAFNELLVEAKNDPNIVGFFLGGSRGKGYEDKFSDYDVKMVVKDEVIEEYQEKFDKELPEIDLVVSSMSEFKEYAAWGGNEHWDRYDHTHVQALVDKNGEIQHLINEKGAIPPNKKQEFISQEIDAYVNHFFRSVKAHRREDLLGAHLAAAVSIPHALNALFALHNRATPFNDYLTREIQHWPLEKISLRSEQLLKTFLDILRSGDLGAQQKLAKEIENLARAEGFGDVFDGWEGKDKWAMNYKLR